ncbi:hypothetical protein [Klenkia taihuensis]|uniref:Uncharacterized protein n=1 Tax=Klenkia taihuensis TaxID=1225127 RepID=A0A1I1J8S8_9ACTN|nr:hypothetical protein [Klenkia taihuensis]GHE11078.1 hypothetical protein GCM10011381_23020 [Klenkia taihuensis]SFC44392.1 hypothetical protein SAMN05661030_0975 [Klenkia taihuensis]
MSDADHSVRSLAEILREHGLESEAGTRPGTTGPVRPKRRRTVEETKAGRGGGPDTGAGTGKVVGRVAGDDTGRRPDDTGRDASRATTPPPPVDAKAAPPRASSGLRLGKRRAPDPAPATVEQPVAGEPAPSTAAIPGLRTGRTPVGGRSGSEPVPTTGPIPKIVLPADADAEGDAEPLTTAQAAVAWVRFAGELVLALAVGVGLYYLFTVLWELQPYVAVVAAPLAITGLVGGVSAWRQRRGQGPVGLRLLLVLLFAGTLLCVVPAAGLLAGG